MFLESSVFSKAECSSILCYTSDESIHADSYLDSPFAAHTYTDLRRKTWRTAVYLSPPHAAAMMIVPDSHSGS